MWTRFRWWIGVCVLIPLLAVLRAPGASAALALGGGAGIIVDGHYCTLTTIGHDKTGQLVGFTAAHCGGPDAPVVAEGSEDVGPLGTVVAANGDLDYAVIKFEAAKVTPIANFAGFVINGLGPNPERGQPECKLGAATGDFCSHNSTFPGPGPTMTMSGLFQPGDDGGPATADNLLVGMIRDGWIISGWPGMADMPKTHLTKFSAILDDVNTTGGPGAGFTPVPA